MRQQWNDKRLNYKDRLHGGMAGKDTNQSLIHQQNDIQL